jgi:two-component system phosphate regulon sensor histidine kinase PhoR
LFNLGIRNRLLITFLLLTILTLLPLGSSVLWYFHRHNIDTLTANLLSQAQITEHLLHEDLITPEGRTRLAQRAQDIGNIDLRVTVIDGAGTVLVDSWQDASTMENHAHRPEIVAALSGRPGSSIRYSETIGENFLYTATPIWHNNNIIGVVRVAATLAHVEAAFIDIRNVLLAAFLSTMLVAILIGFRLARKYTAPLEEITAAANHLAQGNLDARVHTHTGDELDLLAHTLNNLAAHLDDKIKEISAAKRQLELILEHMDNAVVLLDRFGRVTTVNRKAFETFVLRLTCLASIILMSLGTACLTGRLNRV